MVSQVKPAILFKAESFPCNPVRKPKDKLHKAKKIQEDTGNSIAMTIEFDDVILIGGSGRSGTTITGKLLSRHTEVTLAKPVEIKFLTGGTGLIDLYRDPWISRAGKLNLLPNGNFTKFKSSVEKKWWNRESKDGSRSGLHKGINRDVWEDLVAQLEHELQRDRLGACRRFMRSFIDIQKFESGSKLWADTTPTNLIRKDEISQLLPGARFLHVIRDGRDVASSIVRENWGPNTHMEGLRWWKARVRAIINQCQRGDSRVLHIWLEDLVEDRRNESLLSLMNFLGLQCESRFARYFNDEVIPARLHRNRWVNEVENLEEFNKSYQKFLQQLMKKGLPHFTTRF